MYARYIPAPNLTDAYKCGHIYQYPAGTTEVYSNFTPRSDRLAPVKITPFDGISAYDGKLVWFGLQAFIKAFLIDHWNSTFFSRSRSDAVKSYARRMDSFFGPGVVGSSHLEALHDFGRLPIEIRALPEGSRVPMRVAPLTVVNTVREFYWLTNYLETAMSAELWKMSTVATISYEYRRLMNHYADMTGVPRDAVKFQGHDFSMRGIDGADRAAAAGMGHLLSFVGTDTLAAVDLAEELYSADSIRELVGCSVPATEHSVMCMGGKDSEIETFRRLVSETYPEGIVSIVSDTWDFWNVISNTALQLREEILSRQPDANGNAKVVFRPDSGDPVKIITGYMPDELDITYDEEAEIHRYVPADKRLFSDRQPLRREEIMGAVEVLDAIFGSTVNEAGYKVLNQRVGLIYGDSITLDRAQQIMSRLAKKGYASSNVVFGIGSYTYQYLTRDSFGFAIKATAGTVNGEFREIQKDPVTDSGTKKSACGYIRVEEVEGEFVQHDRQTREQMEGGALEVVFRDGEMVKQDTFSAIRNRLGML